MVVAQQQFVPYREVLVTHNTSVTVHSCYAKLFQHTAAAASYVGHQFLIKYTYIHVVLLQAT